MLNVLVLLALGSAQAVTATPASVVSDSPRNTLTLSAGTTWVGRSDKQFSPLPQSNLLPRVGLEWSRRGKRVMHLAELNLGMGSLRSQSDWTYQEYGQTFSNGNSPLTMVDIRYSAGARIEGRRWTLHLGATSQNHFEEMYFVAVGLGVSHYLGVFELAPWADFKLDIGQRHHLEIEGWTPALAWVSRNPYGTHSATYLWATRDNNTLKIIPRFIAAGSVQTPVGYQALHGRATWSYDLHKNWTVAAKVRLDALHSRTPYSMTELGLGAEASLCARF